MKRFSTLFSVLLVSVVIASLGLSACKKDSGPSTAVIKVVDTTGKTITGATVRVFCTEIPCAVDDTSFSNSEGESEHEFENPAVLKVEAFKNFGTIIWLDDTTPRDTFFQLYGEGFIRLEEHERTTEIITVFGSNLQ